MANRSFKNVALATRFPLQSSSVIAQGKPTAVVLGAFSGYSLPVYNNDNEELFFGLKMPRRWDGTTNPVVYVMCHLASAEDVGDKFKLQLSYASKEYGAGVISNTVNDVEVETTLLTGRAAQYDTYVVAFTIDATKLCAGCLLEARLRRIASAETAITGEVIVTDVYINMKRDKLGVKFS